MIDALVGLLDAVEEAFDHVRVRAVVLLVLEAVVHTVHGDKADEIVIRLVIVGDQECLWIDVFGHCRPSVSAVLIHDDPCQRAVRGVLVGLPESQNTHALAVLVFFLAAVLSLLLLVRLAENAADILAVDLHQSLKRDRTATAANGLAELLQQNVGGLVLDVELTAKMERRHALSRRDLLPERHDDLLERQLPVGEDGPGRCRKLGAAFRLRASETPPPNVIRLQTAATRAVRFSTVVGPSEVDEEPVGVILGERPNLLRIEIAAIQAQQRMLSEAFFRIGPGAAVVFRTSGLLRRRGRSSSASRWEFVSGACSVPFNTQDIGGHSVARAEKKVSALFVSI